MPLDQGLEDFVDNIVRLAVLYVVDCVALRDELLPVLILDMVKGIPRP